jgi:hypothetical protein
MLDALEDYMKGPSYLDSLDNGARLREEGDKLPKQQEIPYPSPVDLDDLWGKQRDVPEQLKMFLTRNGNKFLPEKLMRDETVAIPDVFEYYPSGRICWTKHIWLVTSDKKHYTQHDWDRAKYKALEARRKLLMKRWHANHASVEQAWKAAAPYLRSVEAWKKRLGLED